jgi:hypothetical protein
MKKISWKRTKLFHAYSFSVVRFVHWDMPLSLLADVPQMWHTTVHYRSHLQHNPCSCLHNLNFDVIRNYVQLQGLAIVIGLEQTALCVGSELDWLRPRGLICGGTCWYENETRTARQKISCLPYRMVENTMLWNYCVYYLHAHVTRNYAHQIPSMPFQQLFKDAWQFIYGRCVYVQTGF